MSQFRSRYIIDKLNPGAKYLERYCWEGGPEDDQHLREQVLWSRLDNLVGDLIVNTNPTERRKRDLEPIDLRASDDCDGVSFCG